MAIGDLLDDYHEIYIYNRELRNAIRGGWTCARERVLHIFSSLSPVAKVHDFQLCIIAKWITYCC